MANNYTLGRGELHFAQFKPETQNPGGERYIGNTPEWNATIESENLDHYDSDHGIRELDESIVLQTNRNASFITDNISPENIAYFFFGSVTALAVTAQTVDDEVIEGVIQGLTYQLGMTEANPVGARLLDVYTPGVDPTPDVNVIVEPAGGGTAYVEGTDYDINLTTGRLTIIAGGGIASATDIQVSYKTLASTRDRIISGSKPIEGALRYISFNPVGKQFDWYMPYVKLAPNGDYALKGDEWQQIPFSVQILKKAGLEAIYVDGSPLAA